MALQRVAIIGLGVIGASLGLALRRGQPSLQVVGFDIDGPTLSRALRTGAVDRSAGTMSEVCHESDAVVLAAPVRAILQLLPQIAPHVAAGTLVTDVGGTKREIVRVAESVLPPDAAFVGGHPLTGLLTAGVSEPSAKLFDGAVYCLTASPNVPVWAMENMVELVQTSGAQPRWLDADEHDGLLAAVSHLPYFVSIALMRSLATQSGWPEMSRMAAGGFRSVSALTESEPSVWTDVAATNRENVLRQMDMMIGRLTELRQMIETNDGSLLDLLRGTQRAHRGWLADRGEAPSSAPPGEGAGTDGDARGRSWADRLRRS